MFWWVARRNAVNEDEADGDLQDFIHNSTIVYGPDGRKYEIELREFCPRFLFEIGEVDLPPIDSGLEDSPVSSDTE